jgi:hypothetical protein
MIPYDAPLDLQKMYMCCDLQRIARNHQNEKCGISPAATTPRNCYILIFSLIFIFLNKLQRKLTEQEIHTKLLKRLFLTILYTDKFFLEEWNVT